MIYSRKHPGLSCRPAGDARCGEARPPTRPLRTRQTRASAGFTLAEMLIALAILALLLSALALAMHGVMQSYTENAKIAEVTQTARVVLHRIIGEVRTADAIDSASQRISIIPPANDDGVTEIVYELLGGALQCTRTISGSPVTNELVSSDGSVRVESFSISRETDLDGEGVTYTKSLTAVLALRVGDNAFHVTASACPRRNLTLY